MIEVLDPGFQTTVQDGGRPGHLSKGIPPAGPQDHYALLMASLLVGNALPPAPLVPGDPGDAGLEALLKGPTLRFHTDAVVAVTGAEMTSTVDGRRIPLWQSLPVRTGAVLDVGMASKGARGYLAIGGGIDVPLYLGSRATYVRGKQGGLHGRPLRRGDTLKLAPARWPLDLVIGRRVRVDLVPDLAAPCELRVIAGPQEDLFVPESVERFYEAEWRLSPTSDRMGFRFIGPKLMLRDRPSYLVRDAGAGPADIVDEVSPMGGVQVPGGIEPIVLGVEFPSTGGYAKIATVISADLGRLGQMRPGEPARFVPIGVADAVEAGMRQVAQATADALEPVGS